VGQGVSSQLPDEFGTAYDRDFFWAITDDVLNIIATANQR
jgi:hypothetical protein